LFANAVISFLIVAFSVFLLVHFVSKLKKEAPAPDPATKECPHCASTIPLKAKRCPYCTSGPV